MRIALVIMISILIGCAGKDGTNGPTGPEGKNSGGYTKVYSTGYVYLSVRDTGAGGIDTAKLFSGMDLIYSRPSYYDAKYIVANDCKLFKAKTDSLTSNFPDTAGLTPIDSGFVDLGKVFIFKSALNNFVVFKFTAKLPFTWTYSPSHELDVYYEGYGFNVVYY